MIYLAAALSIALPCTGEDLERYDRAIFFDSDSNGDIGHGYCSGFVLGSEGQCYIVTARHMARRFTDKTRTAFQVNTGNVKWTTLGELNGDASPNAWRHSSTADVSILRVDAKLAGVDIVTDLNRIAIQRDQMVVGGFGRTTPIEIVGFPSRLGTSRSGGISAIVFSCNVASIEIETPHNWGIGTAYLASPSVGEGVSGGPVFLSEGGDRSAVRCIGLFYGVLADQSGSKLSVVTPISRCIELIEAQ